MNKTIRRAAATVASLTATMLPYVVQAQTYKPLGQGLTLDTFIGRLINIMLGIVGTLALVSFIYSGFLWMTAGGSADKVKTAKKNMLFAVSGLVVIFTAYAVLDFVFRSIETATGPTG